MEYTLNLADAAKEMGVGPKYVLGLIETGVIPAAKFGIGYRLRKSDVTKYIDLQIAVQTSRRLEQTKANQLLNGSKSPTPVVESSPINRRGRKRNPIPSIPGI